MRHRLTQAVALSLVALLVSCAEVVESPRARVQRRPEAVPVATSPRTDGPAEGRVVADIPPVAAEKPERDPDDLYRENVVGVWKQDYTGVRWLSVRPDGTATMFIDPDWTARLVIGDRLTIDVEWLIEDGKALMKSVGGRPEAGFKAAIALFGVERNRKIAELTDRKFVMLDEADGSTSEWTRVGPGEAVPKELGR